MSFVDRQPGLGNFPPRALLTGAGFSANWGGYLAKDVWGRLLGKMRDDPNLIAVLQEHVGDFERALDAARGDDFSREDLAKLEQAVVEVFRDQQESIDPNKLDLRASQSLLGLFGNGLRGHGNLFDHLDTGYIFTLNQDRLVEEIRKVDTLSARQAPTSPGVHDPVKSLAVEDSNGPMGDRIDRIVRIPITVADNIPLKGNLNYLKLHGSYQWRLQGQQVLVVGGNKARQIADFALLRFYFDVFERVLAVPALRLMVIGYSFGDDHVNEAIANGVRNNGLKLFVIDIRDARQIHQSLMTHPNGDVIFRAIQGFSHAPLLQTLKEQNTSEFNRIKRDFFDLRG
jgi:hypothetical protein